MLLFVFLPKMRKPVEFTGLYGKKLTEDDIAVCNRAMMARNEVMATREDAYNHMDILLSSIDAYCDFYLKMLVQMQELPKKPPKFKWEAWILKSPKNLQFQGKDFSALNGDILMMQHTKAMVLGGKAEKLVREALAAEQPNIEDLITSFKALREAQAILKYIATVLLVKPPQVKDKFKGYPELNISFNLGMSKLFVAEGEMVALEKGIIDTAQPLNLKSRAKLCKDIVKVISEAIEDMENTAKIFKIAYTNFAEPIFPFLDLMKVLYDSLTWLYYGDYFYEEGMIKQSLTCYDEAITRVQPLKEKVPKLGKIVWKPFIEAKMKAIETKCEEVYNKNKSVWFETPSKLSEIEELDVLHFMPDLKYELPGYEEMLKLYT